MRISCSALQRKLCFVTTGVVGKIKKCDNRSRRTEKRNPPIVAKQSSNRKGNPCYHPSGSCVFTELEPDGNRKRVQYPLVIRLFPILLCLAYSL